MVKIKIKMHWFDKNELHFHYEPNPPLVYTVLASKLVLLIIKCMLPLNIFNKGSILQYSTIYILAMQYFTHKINTFVAKQTKFNYKRLFVIFPHQVGPHFLYCILVIF